jgi:Flp pilus assembly pilin Flp
MKNLRLADLLRRVHDDERGAVSLETILILAAIAIPALIFLFSYAAPMIRSWFTTGMNELNPSTLDSSGGTSQ